MLIFYDFIHGLIKVEPAFCKLVFWLHCGGINIRKTQRFLKLRWSVEYYALS